MSLLRRLLLGTLLAGALLFGSLPVAASAAPARRVDADQERVRELVNEARTRRGLGALQTNIQFADRADAWAARLARCRCLDHRDPPYGAPAGWYAAAENVGRGWSFAQIQQAFMNSSGHRANILTRRFTHIGTGVAYAPNGEIFVVQAFMDRTR